MKEKENEKTKYSDIIKEKEKLKNEYDEKLKKKRRRNFPITRSKRRY